LRARCTPAQLARSQKYAHFNFIIFYN
jgi:hypothetical protein